MHPVQSMSTLSCSTISSLEDDLLYHDDQGSLDEEVQQEEESSSPPRLYFEFGVGFSSEDHHYDTDGDHESSLGPRYQYKAIPNLLERLQQSDRACCGNISLSYGDEDEEEFSVSLNQTSSQEGDEQGGDSSFSSFTLSHDGEFWQQSHHRRGVQRRQQVLKYITGIISTKGMKSQGGLPRETGRKVHRLKAFGVDSVELASRPAIYNQTRRTSFSSFVWRRSSRKTISLPSEIDSLVLSMSRLSKQKLQPQEQQKEEDILGSTITTTDKGDGHGSPQEEQTAPARP